MNQRLQELYLDAAKHMEMVQQQGLPAPYQTRALAGKFAELIVRECVSVVDSMADPEDSDSFFWTIQNVSQKIKQHFGVDG